MTTYRPLDVPCPRCDAPPGTPCCSLVFRHRRIKAHPHLDRISAAREATLRSER